MNRERHVSGEKDRYVWLINKPAPDNPWKDCRQNQPDNSRQNRLYRICFPDHLYVSIQAALL
jgi:hypothetical protein